MARHSVSFYVCAAFLAIFGFLGLNGVDPGSAKVELVLAVLVLLAGLYLHSGAEQGRLVGMVALGVVIAYGVWQLTQGQYVPGTIVAGLAMIRLVSAGSTTTAPPVGYLPGHQPGHPQQPYGQPYSYPPAGQPQQMYHGQQPLGPPAPYGSPPSPAGAAPQAYPAPPPPPAPVGDPRFGPPNPYAPPPGR
jgi:uncharacterized membrane protein YtjA (UPF0391 family)